jgi:hypothetical protein
MTGSAFGLKGELVLCYKNEMPPIGQMMNLSSEMNSARSITDSTLRSYSTGIPLSYIHRYSLTDNDDIPKLDGEMHIKLSPSCRVHVI